MPTDVHTQRMVRNSLIKDVHTQRMVKPQQAANQPSPSRPAAQPPSTPGGPAAHPLACGQA